MILASLLLAAAAVQAQTTSWNGHTYEVIWFESVFGVQTEPTGWQMPQMIEHSASLGGHVLTITSAEEQESVGELWPAITRQWEHRITPAMRLGVESIEEHIEPQPGGSELRSYTIHWQTGEVGMFPQISEAVYLLGHIALKLLDGIPSYVGAYYDGDSGGQDTHGGDNGYSFYILEIDPPIGPVDTDGDGLTDDQEKNTRHSYSFVQAPTPVDPVAKTGGFTRDECIADAIARGGHLVDLSSDREFLAAKDALQPWMVGIAFNFLAVTPLLNPFVNLNGQFLCIRSNGADMQYPSNDCCWDPLCMRFSTYILEIEDSTDPNNPDTDADGLTDGQEVLTTLTDPLNADSDGDQLFDGIEINTTKTNPLVADTDGDGLDDYVEVATHKTNPLLADTDGDGFDDKLEVDKGTDPLSPGSLPVVQLEVFPAIEVTMATKAGESYQLQISSDLQTWAPFGDVFVGTGQPYARFIAAREQASFLRAVIVN